jgi:hypothetical protein
MFALLHSLYISAVTNETPINVTGLPGYNKSQGLATNDELQRVLQIVFGVVGALALLVITVSGFRYVLSTGDPQKTAQAKDGIIYSLVGLVVAISAEAIVTFVLGKL